MDSQILLEVKRGNYVDSRYRGDIAVVESNGKLVNFIGDPYRRVYQRSASKPFQALNFILSGAYDKYDITQEELALICSSHYAESQHIIIIQSILDKIGLNEDQLQCGLEYSLKKEVREKQIWQNLQKRSIFNDCSGKHAAMLATCKLKGYELNDYNSIGNPVQQDIKAILEQMFECELEWGIDGCTLPAFITPLFNFALGFAKLADYDIIRDEKLQDACQLVFESMRKYPYMVAGSNGFCTQLMSECDGIVGKLGAEAVYGIGFQNEKVGLAFKTEDGDYERGLYPIVVEALQQLKYIKLDQLDQFKIIDNLNKIGQKVGEIKPCFKFPHQNFTQDDKIQQF